ncbi:MAG: tape measure protein, partial [Alistipes sp.]|nr:tape measure protein [Alistipes sp.]
MADLSLKIAVKLLTKSFKSGVNNLSTMLRGLQMQFMAFASTLGIGTVGLSNFLQRMREVAKETTSANIALKNVSKSAGEFANHQGWLVSVSKKYGVQINTLTSGFAKFKAAADISNMSLDSQRKIFESVARASVAFGLSSEDQRGVFMALQQMMSKGKVMAEELRLQLAERMPVAIQAMAKALGVSVTQMDALMKQGKVLSSDVLPKFAEELTKMIPNIDLDNLNKSLTDLSNTFVELTKKLNVEGAYKGLVDGLNAILKWAMQSAKGITSTIWAFIAAVFGRMSTNLFNYFKGSAEKATAHAEKLIKDKARAAESVAKAEENLAKQTLAHQQAIDKQKALSAEASEAQKLKAKERVASAERALDEAKLRHSRAVEKQQQTDALVTAEVIEQANLRNATSYQKFVVGFKNGIKSLGASLKAFALSNIWTGILTVLAGAVSYLVKLYKESERIKKLAEETRKELNAPLELSAQEQNVSALYKVTTDKDKYTAEEREAALKQLNDLLGTQYKIHDLIGKKQDEINAKVQRYIGYIQAQQRLERAQALVTQRTAEFDEWKKANPDWEAERGKLLYTYHPETGEIISKTESEASVQLKSFEDSIVNASAGVEAATAEVAKYAKEFDKAVTTTVVNDNGGTIVEEKESELDKLRNRYARSMAELDAEYQAQLITEREYRRKKKDIIEKAYIDATSGGDSDVLGSNFYRGLSADFASFGHGALREREEQLEDRLAQYDADIAEQSRLLKSGAVTQEQYQKTLRELSSALYRELSSLDYSGLSPEAVFAADFAQTKAMLANAGAGLPAYTPRRRDRTKDFARTQSGVLAEELKDAQHYLDYLREAQENVIGGLSEEINAQLARVNNLEDALQLARAQEEVKKLSSELRKGVYDGIRGSV